MQGLSFIKGLLLDREIASISIADLAQVCMVKRSAVRNCIAGWTEHFTGGLFFYLLACSRTPAGLISDCTVDTSDEICDEVVVR